MAQSGDNSRKELAEEMNRLLADHIALFIKTKNFHWHLAGPRFRDLHLLFDEQAIEIRDQIDAVAERVRKIDEFTLTSVGSVARHTQVKDQDDVTLTPDAMIRELLEDNRAMVSRLKGLKDLCDKANDNATDGMLDEWTDLAEERCWFLRQTLR